MSVVRRRCVFYLSGFDPRGASFYHGLYQEEAAKQSRLNGWHLDIGARKRLKGGNSIWQINAGNDAGAQVSTHYEFMRWDDVVRDNWPRSTLSLWRDLVITTLFNLRHGSLWQMFKLSWPPAVALFAPFVLLILMALVAPFAAVVLGTLAVFEYQWPGWAGAGVAMMSLVGAWNAGRYLEARYSMYWLTRSYAFTARQALGQVPDLEKRLNEQAKRLVECINEGQDDEILLVAHSSGTIMAVCILARAAALLQAQKQVIKTTQAKVSLMTLGQCIPLLALLPQAQQFREDLSLLGQTDWLDWIDFSAPPDGSCFALSDPMALTVGEPVKSPKLLSPKFAAMFDPLRYRSLRKDKFRIHFQYLMSHERAVDYDFFLITAGDRTLQERFAHVQSVTSFRQ